MSASRINSQKPPISLLGEDIGVKYLDKLAAANLLPQTSKTDLHKMAAHLDEKNQFETNVIRGKKRKNLIRKFNQRLDYALGDKEMLKNFNRHAEQSFRTEWNQVVHNIVHSPSQEIIKIYDQVRGTTNPYFIDILEEAGLHPHFRVILRSREMEVRTGMVQRFISEHQQTILNAITEVAWTLRQHANKKGEPMPFNTTKIEDLPATHVPHVPSGWTRRGLHTRKGAKSQVNGLPSSLPKVSHAGRPAGVAAAASTARAPARGAIVNPQPNKPAGCTLC